MNVSKGPELFPLPDTVGQSVEKAQATLEGSGFVVKVVQPAGHLVLG